MDYTGIGIIVDYRYLQGPLTGRRYRRRFENVASFSKWAEQYDNPGIVEILNSRVVDSDRVYWDDRWVAEKAD